jgi:hypothetical protein
MLMLTQNQFDQFIADYNEDYRLLLTRASQCHYECLITSWLILKDLYNLITTLYDMEGFTYQRMPYPFSFRGNDVLLTQLGFNQEEISNIYEFLSYVLRTQGKDFDRCMEEGASVMCASIRK